jgi:excisionase family DNA binding protein
MEVMRDSKFTKLVTLETAAARLGCSLATIRRRISAGKLEVTHVLGRVLVVEASLGPNGDSAIDPVAAAPAVLR